MKAGEVPTKARGGPAFRLFACLALLSCSPLAADPEWIRGEWHLTWDDQRDGSLSEQHTLVLGIQVTGDGFIAQSPSPGGDTLFRGRTWHARGVTLVAFDQIGAGFRRVFSGAAVRPGLLAGTYYGTGNGPPGSSGEWRLERSPGSGFDGAASEYLGCFRDQRTGDGTAGRDLPAAAWNDPGMTNRLCIDFCAGQSFPYAGTQYGNWCFCGDRYGQSGKAKNCDVPCAGDRNETCGGSWANSVYQVGLTDPPAAGPCPAAVAAVHAWAAAWSRQDAELYLSYYSRDFSPPHGLSRKAWEVERRQRIERPGIIGVKILAPEVEVCEARRARLIFLQIYTSDVYRDRVRKEVRLSRPGNRWQIVAERSLDGE